MSDESNLTFENLNKLCNGWITDTEIWKGRFKDQSSEINDFFNHVGNNHKKLTALNIHINVLHYYQNCLDNTLCELQQEFQCLEQRVNEFEKCWSLDKTDVNIDPCRAHIYKSTENLFITLNNLNESLESAQNSIIQPEANAKENNTVENVVKMLGSNLSNLEKVEAQIYKIENEVNKIATLKEVLVQKYELQAELENLYPTCFIK